MNITTNYSITQLFATKDIDVYLDGQYGFFIRVPTTKLLLTDRKFNRGYLFITSSIDNLNKLFLVKIKNVFTAVKLCLFNLIQYKEYKDLIQDISYTLRTLIPDLKIDTNQKQLKVNDVIITEEIWDYFIYIIKLSCGEKVSKPVTFNSEAEKQWYLAQQEMDARIKKVREKGSKSASETDSLAKILLYITYAFPSMTIDYLYNQTLAQIHWLHKYAAGSVSYSINAQALAAGNTKKKQIDFFIK